LPPKGDIVDWASAGGTREALDELIARAPDWQPPEAKEIAAQGTEEAKAEARQQELLDTLAQLPRGIEFARQRKKVAREFGVSQAMIDAELEARRGEKAVVPLHDHWVVEPWPEPVDGDALLRDIIQRIQRHVVCSPQDALAIALWIVFAWVHDEVAAHSPILNISSAEPESGKSTTLGLVSFLAPRCVSSVEISKAALYRAIKLWRPSFVIDEFDSVLASEDKGALRSIINSGHTRGQGVIRCLEPDYTPQLFETFSPKAIGMVGRKLPATTLGRCIIVELRRRKSTEPIERFTHRDDAELGQLRSQLARWGADNEDALRDAKPSMPDTFDNRRADNWRVMLGIADLAGGDRGDQARLAASKLEGASDTSSIGARLLADIKRVFDEDGRECILSAVLVERLKEDPEQPWAEWGRSNKGLTQNSLAVLLGGGGGRGRGSRGGFGIRSVDVHPSRDVHGKGYQRSQFEDAWARYLPAENPLIPPDGGE
jgi:putative DNA primase/helicase